MQERIGVLRSMSSREYGLYAFARDPVNHRLEDGRRLQMIDRANECGRRQARELIARYGKLAAPEYAARLRVWIRRKDSAGVGDYPLFASFEEPDRITLYMKNVEDARELIEDNDLAELLDHVDLEEVLLFHELFHVLEARDSSIYTRTEKIALWKLGPLRGATRLVALSEIAAMAFAQECLSIDYSPFLFDVLLPWKRNPPQAEKLYRSILNYRRD